MKTLPHIRRRLYLASPKEEDSTSRGRFLMPYMYVTMLFWRRRAWTWVHGGEAGNEARLGKG